MAGIIMTITDAGLDALVDAQGGGSDEIEIVSLGLSNTPFVAARTITAMPGQFKLLSTVTGLPVAENIIHLTAYDTSDDVYDVTGFGLYLTDGTLFAAYSSDADPVLSKASLAFSLFSHDISFDNSVSAAITFGDAAFSYPPASETVKGVAEIADNDEADEGLDDTRIMSPKKVKRRTDLLSSAISTLIQREITGGGLVTGGGDLSNDRVLTVPKADPADVAAGTNDEKALTAQALSGLPRSLLQNGYCDLPGCGGLRIAWGRFTAATNGTTAVTFPTSFTTSCFSVIVSGTNVGGDTAQDNPAAVIMSTVSASGFSVFSSYDETINTAYLAIGI